MKKLIVIFVLAIVAIACQDESLQPVDEGHGASRPIEVERVGPFNGCLPDPGYAAYVKNGNYNNNQYIRGGLILNGVNLYNGNPNGGGYYSINNSQIQQDDNFIRVCNLSDAEAVAVLPQSEDHTSLVLGDDHYAYAYSGGTHVYKSTSPLNCGFACDYEYYSSIEDIYMTGPVISGNTYTFTLHNLSNHPYVLTDANRWSYYTGAWNTISKTNTTLTVSPIGSYYGTHTISALIKTTATNGSCPLGVNGIETATTHIPKRSKSFVVTPPVDCGGQLNGGTLNTVNENLPLGITHNVVMNDDGWTWTLMTSPSNIFWNTSNNGQNMNFSLYLSWSGESSATFQASKPGCPTKTITFTE